MSIDPDDQIRFCILATMPGRNISWPASRYMMRRSLREAAKLGASIEVEGEKTVIRYMHGLEIVYEPIKGEK